MRSETSITFDADFHKQCEDFKEIYEDMLFSMKSIADINIADCCYNFDILDEFIEKISEFRRIRNIGKMNKKYFHPDNFAFITSVICGGHRFEKWEDIDIKKETQHVGTITSTAHSDFCDKEFSGKFNVDFTSWCIMDNHHIKCSCSHLSKDIYFIKGKYTNIVIPVGSSCIDKYEIISSETMKRIKKVITYHKETYKHFKECVVCKKDFKCENRDVIYCIDCRPDTRPICEYCDTHFTPKFQNAKNCLDCFKTYKKECVVCRKAYLPSYKSKDYSTKCPKCYYG